ncbi:hypothetical protein BDW59DRAFT_165044 [Aspergillus cavernicola]|uniref:Uncharacterized protein n=1 Tax=Aspergillus cavernicola TaxID=176166 RepID=A0ABR4HVR5_9EURO
MPKHKPITAAAAQQTEAEALAVAAAFVGVVVPAPPAAPGDLGYHMAMTNIFAWPAAPLPANFRAMTSLAPSGLFMRTTWDTLPPAAVSNKDWATAQFVDYQRPWLGVYSFTTPAILPGLAPWTGLELLSSREKQWLFTPVVRHICFCGFTPRDQLVKQAQYREATLVTHPGRKQPAGHECLKCAGMFAGASAGSPAFIECISRGIGQKCNNCL